MRMDLIKCRLFLWFRKSIAEYCFNGMQQFKRLVWYFNLMWRFKLLFPRVNSHNPSSIYNLKNNNKKKIQKTKTIDFERGLRYNLLIFPFNAETFVITSDSQSWCDNFFSGAHFSIRIHNRNLSMNLCIHVMVIYQLIKLFNMTDWLTLLNWYEW